MAAGENGEAERSLRDDLAAGLKEIEERDSAQTPAEPNDEGSKPSEAEADAKPAETQSDRGDGRDAQGRFLPKPKEGEETAAAPPQPESQASESATDKTEAQQPPEQSTDAAPKSWRADEAQAWKDLPATAKSAILRREAEAARLAGANDGERMFGREFAEIVRPHMDTIQSFGVTPQFAVKALLENDKLLRSGNPEQKLAKARQLLVDYGIDPQAVAQPDPNAPSDPYVAQLKAELEQVKARLGQHGQAQQQQQFAPLPPSPEEHNILTEIEAFRADPAHPHFDAVRPTMGKLLETGAAPDLESAYQAAVAMVPALRSTVAAQAPQRTQEKAAAARRASASVTGSPGPAGNPSPMSLRDELNETARRLGIV